MKKTEHTSETTRTIIVKGERMAGRYVMKSIEGTYRFAKKLVKELHGGGVLALSGNLGSGKTTFTQMVARELGAKEQVTSPTFVLMKLYEFSRSINGIKRLCHIDAYRLGSAGELEAIGAQEYIGDPDTLSIIEWPENVRGCIPKDATWISFELGDTV